MIFVILTDMFHDGRLMVVATHLDNSKDDDDDDDDDGNRSDEDSSNGDDPARHEENTATVVSAQVDRVISLVHLEIKEVIQGDGAVEFAKNMIVPVSSSHALISRQAALYPKDYSEKVKDALKSSLYPPSPSKSNACLLEEYSQITVFEKRFVHLKYVYTFVCCNFLPLLPAI